VVSAGRGCPGSGEVEPVEVHDPLGEMENVVRWTLAATGPQRVPRPNVEARLAMLRTALGGQAGGDDDAAQFLLRTVLLLTFPMAWLYWRTPSGSS
jgi:hypothetical protein